MPLPARESWQRLGGPEALTPYVPGMEAAEAGLGAPERYRFRGAASVGPAQVRLRGSAQVRWHE